MSLPLLLDLTHTSHTRARTGIQRVTRALYTTLGAQAAAVAYDPYARHWRKLEAWEIANLTATDSAANKRGAKWPLHMKLRGRFLAWSSHRKAPATHDRYFAQRHSSLPASGSGLLVPEIFSPTVAAALPALFASTPGPRVALFHDAIALKFPELTPSKTVVRFPAYLRELLAFDGVATISEDSRQSLLDFWRWLGVTQVPEVQTIPLGIDDLPASREGTDNTPRTHRPVVLSVGSVEGRKNHLALLEASEQLWSSGLDFELRIIGLAHPQTGRAALERIQSLQGAGRPLRYEGPVSDAILEGAYRECAFTVYPSLIEGFGLPVLESLARGKPCICSGRGALAESARGGGCVTLQSMDSASLATAIETLLRSGEARQMLTAAATSRHFKSWSTYTHELVSWMASVRRRHD